MSLLCFAFDITVAMMPVAVFASAFTYTGFMIAKKIERNDNTKKMYERDAELHERWKKEKVGY